MYSKYKIPSQMRGHWTEGVFDSLLMSSDTEIRFEDIQKKTEDHRFSQVILKLENYKQKGYFRIVVSSKYAEYRVVNITGILKRYNEKRVDVRVGMLPAMSYRDFELETSRFTTEMENFLKNVLFSHVFSIEREHRIISNEKFRDQSRNLREYSKD